MAARKPSERRNFEQANMDPDLGPMMGLISILIPCLLISMVFVEIAVINVAAPAIGNSPQEEEEKKDKPDKPPLNLTVTITDKGYILAGSGGVLPGVTPPAEGEEASGPTIPLVEQKVSCDRYVGMWPPPRSVNRSREKCTTNTDVRMYKVYDIAKLSTMLIGIKDSFPEEKKVIIAAESDVEFECITDVMDTTRDVKIEGEERRDLFPEVVLSPGLG
jgi:biopolymer transport protein ExbD